uniref:Uncharacterized protein n=1 Tax=Daphnia galeata TaxID=27404 RepID=A0A8J2WGM7_9CRUS|nr:unnamed protein product [Daphnia galeata]
MSVRRVKGSYRNSLRRFGSGDPNKAVRNSAWIFRNGEWRLIFDDGEEACLLYAKHEKNNSQLKVVAPLTWCSN